MSLVRLFGAATLAAIAVLILRSRRREHRAAAIQKLKHPDT
jgi:hypothetical protein